MTSKRLLFIEPPRIYWFVMGEYLPPPTTLLILAAYVEQELPNLEIEVLDCQAQQMDWSDLERYIQHSKPDIILTSGFTCNAYSCARTVEIAKTVNQDIITIVGGIHFTFTPEDSLLKFPEIDYIVRGEGELTLVDLLKNLLKKQRPTLVKGISYRHNDTVVHTPDRPLIKNLDRLPYPAYHFVEDNIKSYHFTMMAGKHVRYLTLEGSRGCTHQCTFCTQWNHWGATWRKKSEKRIADEIEFLNETYGGQFLWLCDDHINLKQRGKPLYQELKQRTCKDDIMLFFQARTDDVAHNPELIGNLRSVGTYWIMCGVENDSIKTLSEYKKGTKTKDAYLTMKILRDHDVFSHAMFVIGNRRDTVSSIQRLREYAIDLAPDFAIFTALTPFPGTQYYQLAKENGWIEDNNYTNYDMAHAIMSTETLTRSEVQYELWRCYKEYYGNIIRNISGFFSKNKLKRTLYRHMAGQHVLSQFKGLI